jgi:hypothetical protein
MKKIFWIGGAVIFLSVLAAGFLAVQYGQKEAMYFSGKVTLDPSLEPNAQDIRTLYLSLFDDAVESRRPYGAMRIQLIKKPKGKVASFTANRDTVQVMFPGSKPPEVFRVRARLDRDGIAGPASPGDLLGEIKSVALGSRNIEVNISKIK